MKANLFEQMAKLEAMSRSSVRYARQQSVEREVAALAPTYDEAIDIMEALQIGVEAKYPDVPLGVTYAFADLRKALSAAQASQVDPVDEAYDIQRANDDEPR